jgi:hypothetical protein
LSKKYISIWFAFIELIDSWMGNKWKMETFNFSNTWRRKFFFFSQHVSTKSGFSLVVIS